MCVPIQCRTTFVPFSLWVPLQRCFCAVYLLCATSFNSFIFLPGSNNWLNLCLVCQATFVLRIRNLKLSIHGWPAQVRQVPGMHQMTAQAMISQGPAYLCDTDTTPSGWVTSLNKVRSTLQYPLLNHVLGTLLPHYTHHQQEKAFCVRQEWKMAMLLNEWKILLHHCRLHLKFYQLLIECWNITVTSMLNRMMRLQRYLLELTGFKN